MRRFGPLLLLAIVAVLGAVGFLYRAQRDTQQRSAPVLPAALPAEKSASLDQFCWNQTQNGRTTVQVCASSFEQVKSPSRGHLTGVEVQIFDPGGLTFDRFTTKSAEYNIDDGVLYADGEVEITTGVPAGDRPGGRRVYIKTSGLKFESKAGRASTDQPTTFQFENGEGSSVGASYDPEYRELTLKSRTRVTWRGKDRKSQPLTVETEELIYKEKESVVLVGPATRFRRGTMTVEGGRGVAWLKEGTVDRIEATGAKGLDQPEPGRRVEYSADWLFLHFGPGGEIQRISADKNARLRSSGRAGVMELSADHVDLAFDLGQGESRLNFAVATGRGVVESAPAAPARGAAPPRRILRSEKIELRMRPGGEEIQQAETTAPGVIELIPASRQQPRRRLEGERIVARYGPGNRIETLTATSAATRTESAAAGGRPAPPMLTWSRELKAGFDAETSELARLEQWGDFRYEEGDRRGRSGRAVFEAKENRITLETAARVWDATGSVAADRIRMNQRNGDVEATGGVASTREPDKATTSNSLLSAAEPFHATASRMLLDGAGRRILYEGNAVVWQGGNRIEADRVEIDRAGRSLAARGNVRSRFLGQPAGRGGPAASLVTVVRAPELDYSDATRTALYRGGVTLVHGAIRVAATELRGVFSRDESSPGLETAIADGAVVIEQAAGGRLRKGTGGHAEYLLAEEKVVLTGGMPEFRDSQRGFTRGRQLTWFARDDRLLVDGRPDEPAVSLIRRK